MTMTNHTKISVRLALRVEGNWWVAYLAKPDTMDDAQELGRVLMTFVSTNGVENARGTAFKELMRDAMEEHLRKIAQVNHMTWDERPAPMHERGGNA